MKNNKGFSLVELIVVIAIMAILAAVAIPTFATFINKANVASDEQFVNDVKYAAELANTIFGEDVTDVEVTLVAGGVVDTVTYKVGEVDVTINVKIDGEEEKVVCTDDKIKAAADDVIKAMDWTYTFKSEKEAGTWTYSTTDKAWSFGA